MNGPAEHVLFQVGLLFLAGLAAGKVAEWLRVPDIVLYLLAGIVLGPPLLGWIDIPAESTLSELILVFGAAFMLYEGGREVDLPILGQVWRTVALLSTTGVLLTALPVALAAMWLLHLPFLVAFLLAAVLSPTDPATIIPIFQQVRLRPRLAQTAQSESAFNDATGSVLVVSLLSLLMARGLSGADIAAQFVLLIAGGIGVGLLVGFVASALIAHGSRIPRIFGESETGSVMSLVIIIGAYLLAEAVGASGFMAVFVAGIVNGNKPAFGLRVEDEHERVHRHFFSVNALIMRMLIFILLGSHVDFGVLGRYLWPLMGVMAVLIFVGRPLAVLLSAGVDRAVRWTRNELLFLMWVRETGVIPAALAGILTAEHVPHAGLIQAAVFAAILSTLLLQGSTTSWAARRLGVLAGEDGSGAQAV
ncbi:MAG: sodium:proton antiporter [Firmicutes bacterium]|nr:sodium:proton antiporter [Bacillota bacterium]